MAGNAHNRRFRFNRKRDLSRAAAESIFRARSFKLDFSAEWIPGGAFAPLRTLPTAIVAP